jgi:hypothetical protein
MTIYLTDSTRALIRWIPEHFLGHTGYSDGALREVADELRQAADRIEYAVIDRVVIAGEPTLRRPRDQDR